MHDSPQVDKSPGRIDNEMQEAVVIGKSSRGKRK